VSENIGDRTMPKHLREVKESRLRKLYDEGLSIRAIAEIENLAPSSILKLMRKYGIKRRTISAGMVLHHSKE